MNGYISPALARELDRLARRAHRFHRFAHHPLCAEYRHELIRLGRRTWLCRGCTLAVAGAMLGALLGALVPLAAPSSWWVTGVLAAVLACGVAGLVAPRAPAPAAARGRAAKVATRLLPLALLGFAALLGGRLGGGGGGVLWLAAGFTAVVWHRAYRRRGPNRSACASCPERESALPCRGVAPIVRRERAFMRRTRRLLSAVRPD